MRRIVRLVPAFATMLAGSAAAQGTATDYAREIGRAHV